MVMVGLPNGRLRRWWRTPPGLCPGGLLDPSTPALLTSSGLILCVSAFFLQSSFPAIFVESVIHESWLWRWFLKW